MIYKYRIAGLCHGSHNLSYLLIYYARDPLALSLAVCARTLLTSSFILVRPHAYQYVTTCRTAVNFNVIPLFIHFIAYL